MGFFQWILLWYSVLRFSELFCCFIPTKDGYEEFLFIPILLMNGDIHGEFKSVVIQWELELIRLCFFSDSICKLFGFLLSIKFYVYAIVQSVIFVFPCHKSSQWFPFSLPYCILTGWGGWFGNGCELVWKIIVLWKSHLTVFTRRKSVDAYENWGN